MHCKACRRPRSNPVSIQHGYGPDCLKRAVQAGTAPMTALGEMVAWQRSRPKQQKQRTELKHIDTKTMDLFAKAKVAALDDMHKAAEVCRSFGLSITITIEEITQ